MFWQIIIKNKSGLGEETTFDFKYIPNLSKKTQMEDALDPGPEEAGLERRNLQALGIGCVLLALAGVLCFKVVTAVITCAVKWLP